MRISTTNKIGLVTGAFGSIVYLILVAFYIFKSITSGSLPSMAGIGLIFVPIFIAISFAGFFIWGYCLAYIKTWLASTTAFNFKIGLAFLIGIFFTVLLIMGPGKHLFLNFYMWKIGAMSTNQELLHTFENSPIKSNKFVLGAITQNPAASAELLDRIAKLNDPSLHYRMGWTFFPVVGDNPQGWAVMELVARNHNVSSATLEHLVDTSPSNYVLYFIALNSKTPDETLSLLETKQDYLVDWGLAQNPKTPPDVLAKLLDRKKDYSQQWTLKYIVRNPSTPPEIRTRASELLKGYPSP